MSTKILPNVLLFVILGLSLIVSTSPALFSGISPFRYLHLIVFVSVVVVSVREFPLIFLVLFGLVVDSLHGHFLGSSSLLFVLILPYIALARRAGASNSRIWVMFVAFLLLYQVGQGLLHFFLQGQPQSYHKIAVESLLAILLFPMIFTVSLYFLRYYEGLKRSTL